VAEKPLVFISCGQFTPDEIQLGKDVEQLIRDETPYDAYFAEQQNSLDGLSSNILGALNRAAAFVGIMHHRGTFGTPSGKTVVRGSVWVEQELAIAAFIQNALARRIEVVLYLERGITREGIRSQLRLAPVEFDSPDEVLKDLRERIKSWALAPARPQSLVAEWEWKLQHPYTGERHPYKFFVNLFNNGSVMVDQWQADLWFPSLYVEGADTREPFIHHTDNDTNYSPHAKRIWPGARLPLFNVDYVITNANWPDRPGWPGKPYVPPKVRIRVSTANAPPWEAEISAKDIQNF
jgi:hypothetical protein